MLNMRPIAGLFVVASILMGCASSGLPDIQLRHTVDSRNTPWPEFLPIEMILSADIADFDRSLAEIENLQWRANQLRKRAKLLKRPVVEAYERIRLQQAIDRRLP